jgi:predicted lysophospholipase L1 biosynthesis ABC-type transport system permease subunit
VWLWLLSFFPPAAGVAAGIVGVVLGARGVMKRARDDRERRQLRWFAAANIAAIVVCGLAFQMGRHSRAWFPILSFLAFNVVMLTLHMRWLPRIVARRRAAEMAEDPIGAERRRRRERIYMVAGWVGGLGLGWAGLLLGLLASHKL